ncbi:MAG: thiamine pyridinylase [Lachnospiraceae bacterium]|nr:thiamine pyridinylase [Lachnospiraceae bacterium]
MKKNFRIVMAALMAAICLTACGDEPSTDPGVQDNKVQDEVQQENTAQDDVTQGETQQEDVAQEEKVVLNVAMYPYVPAPEYFQDTLQKAWDELKQSDEKLADVTLDFKEWDCYENSEIDDSLDVMVFDSIFLTEYASKGELLQISDENIDNSEDILGFVQEGIKVNGDYYGLPQMICANLFFYRPDDTEVASAGNVDKLYEVMGDYEGTEERLKDGEGLLVDMSSGTGNVCLYLDAIVDSEAVYTDFTQMPDVEHISDEAIESLNDLIKMGGVNQVYAETSGSYDRAKWFSEGSGRAYIGYSESMAEMGDYVSQVQISTLALANREDIPLFYVDIAAINDDIAENKEYAALKLLNLMTSGEVMTETILGSQDSGPLYIMPARKSCYEDLMADIPIYTRLQEITGKSENHVFRMGADAHAYIKETKKILPQYLIQK